jgi:hypothetical protein
MLFAQIIRLHFLDLTPTPLQEERGFKYSSCQLWERGFEQGSPSSLEKESGGEVNEVHYSILYI